MAARRRKEYENSEYTKLMSRMLKAYIRRVGDGDPEDLTDLAKFYFDVEAALRESVQGQREQGRSWTEIGDALGISRQAAQQRFGRQPQ